MSAQGFSLDKRTVILLVLGGILAFFIVVLLLKLPEKFQRGEQGQAAIQMLDAMRRPILWIKAEEARVAEADASRRLAVAVDAANDLLERYKNLARYNPVLSTSVATLSSVFNDWVLKERRLFECVAASSIKTPGVSSYGANACNPTPAATGFLYTMDALGEGEGPIHADITEGSKAFRDLQVCFAILLLYLIGLAYWAERRAGRRERALLLEHLRAEKQAATLEKALGETLAKVLGGFIPICANCKSIRTEENQWVQVELYVASKTDAQFSHGMCPDCMGRLYGHLPYGNNSE